MPRKIGVLSAGGDCPGINAVIRAVTKTAMGQGREVIGFLGGYGGIVEKAYMPLDEKAVSGLLHRVGTFYNGQGVCIVDHRLPYASGTGRPRGRLSLHGPPY